MSVGQVVGGIAGAVVGFFAGGGPQGALVGAQLGMGVGGMVDPPKGPHIYGPKLTDLTTQTSTYGATIPRIKGTFPVTGNVFWLENNQLKETENTQKQGKGGGGSETTTFTYSATFAVGLADCRMDGPIAGVRRIWLGANLIYDIGSSDIHAMIASAEAAGNFKIYYGDDTQLPDPRMQAALGVANTPAYRGLAYIVFYDLPLKDYQNSLIGAQVKVELASSATMSDVASTVIVSDTSVVSSSGVTVLANTIPTWASIYGASWIWDVAAQTNGTADKHLTFTKQFTPVGAAVSLEVACDNTVDIYFNGNLVGSASDWASVATFDLSRYVISGVNTLSFRCTNIWESSLPPSSLGNPAGLIFKITMAATSIIEMYSVPLSTVVSSECLQSKLLTASDIDVTALTSMVRGYAISSVAAIRSGFDPLIGAWPFDVIQSGYKIVFKPRGGSSVVTIPAAKLDARSASSQPGVQITNAREMDSVLPSKVAVKYLDSDREYNINEQYAERLNTQSINVSAVDLAMVLSADEAAQKAEILLYLYWLERDDVSFHLPPEYNYLEPSDVTTITAPDAAYELRLTQINCTPDGRLECQAKYNSAAVYTSSAVGGTGTAPEQTLTIPGPTQYELLDTPLMNDVFDTAGFPVAMSGYLAGWPGGILMRSDDDGQVWNQIQGFSRPGSLMGYVFNSLSAHSGLSIDKASVLSVTVNQPLSSVTELQMLNGANHFACGMDGRWEIIAAQNCVLQADGSYILTDLLRGRFGSEWATGLHAANDHLVLLNTANLQFIASNLNVIGMARSYRGITTGKTLDSDSDRTMTYQGVNLKCLSPVYLNGNRHPTTRDWTLTWIRRTRKGGELRDLVDAPLSEVSEAYSIDVFTDGTYLTVKRTLAATAPTVVYSSANQVADFGSNQVTLYVKIYQLSATTGRGYPLITRITR
ncbi:phage tail protein [Glaciimonas sp. PCH181]|uniref:phage tail protein n=1 Tax=Glaciimonas sp. PCH181 TaxID=2133943 RepID=UPI000D367A62|nr:phage tail protein [Glaciimonas sp. PCH181]PUA17255.1 hypothetical protein C7W93_15090 [Glaciimonas sp. PCH181]